VDEWVSSEIHPETPPEGMLLSVRLPGIDWDGMYQNLRRSGAQYGISFGDVKLLSNSRLSLEAGEYARDHGRFDEYHEEIFRAYFTEVQDIGRMDVILDAARSAGLDAEALQSALKKGFYRDRLQAAQQESERYGVTGVPAFIIEDQYKIVGAQPMEVFRELMQKLGK
jgi:predicted DsbA family dithiol-disulfide isomerase